MSKNHPPVKSPSSKPILVFDPNNPAAFKDLVDTINSYAGQGGKFLIVKPDESGIGVYEGTFEFDKYFLHLQPAPALTWDITHNLGKFPACQVMTSTGYEIGCRKQHLSINRTILYFDEPFAGYATFN